MQQSPSVNDVLNRYAPPAKGEPGFLAGVMNVVARAVDKLPQLGPAFEASAAPQAGAETVFLNLNRGNQKVISSNPLVPQALERMESMLQNSFQAASRPGASAEAKKEFIELARQIQLDAKVLKSEYRVQGPADPATGGYAFVVAQRGQEQVSLGEAFRTVQRASYRSGHDIIRGAGQRVVMMLPAKGVKSSLQTKLP